MINFNPLDYSCIVGWQYDLVFTKESVPPVSDKLYHTNERVLQKWEEIENLRSYAFLNPIIKLCNVHIAYM